MIESLERVSPTVVRVEWSQPPGGAAITGYVVFYYDGSVTRNKSISSTSTEITVSSATLIYVISVMALRGAVPTSKECLGDYHTV